ncbi:MAG: hypothetical protein IJY82_00045 [Oscillospiraceae bacterium]|nr:hypothetical protein [Oscillospiraceae bacterium]
MKRILLCIMAAALVASSLSGCMVLGGVGAVLGQMQAGEKQPAQNASAGDPGASSQSGTTSRVEDFAPNGTSPDNGKEELSPTQPAPEQDKNENHENNTNDDRNDQWTEDEDAGWRPEEEPPAVEIPSRQNELVAYDNTFSVEGFPGWYRESASLNAASDLTISDETGNFGMMFITERKSDFGGTFTPEEVVGFMANNIRNADPEASVGRIRMTKVDGYLGATCTVEATVSGMNLTYQLTAVDRDDYFLEISSWSKNSMANQGQKYFLEIMESYKER